VNAPTSNVAREVSGPLGSAMAKVMPTSQAPLPRMVGRTAPRKTSERAPRRRVTLPHEASFQHSPASPLSTEGAQDLVPRLMRGRQADARRRSAEPQLGCPAFASPGNTGPGRRFRRHACYLFEEPADRLRGVRSFVLLSRHEGAARQSGRASLFTRARGGPAGSLRRPLDAGRARSLRAGCPSPRGTARSAERRRRSRRARRGARRRRASRARRARAF
jgi:hypothetical protein